MKNISRIVAFTMALTQASAHAHGVGDVPTPPIEVVKNYFTFLQTGNIGGVIDLLSDNVIWHQPGQNILSPTYEGREAVVWLFQSFMNLSDRTFRIDEVNAIMANGNLVSASLTFSASRSSASLSMVMPGIDVMKIIDGKIVEVWLFSADQDAEDRFWGMTSN